MQVFSRSTPDILAASFLRSKSETKSVEILKLMLTALKKFPEKDRP